jgi:hypothetical protein
MLEVAPLPQEIAMALHRWFLSACAVILLALTAGRTDEEADFFKPVKQEKEKPPAGKAEMLRHVPKKFASLVSADAEKLQVTLHVEGEEAPKTWPINPDAEIKVHGWWGRLNQFWPGDRVWVWFAVDRQRQPKSVLMLADEISQQDILGTPVTLEAVDTGKSRMTVKTVKGQKRTLATFTRAFFEKHKDGFQLASYSSEIVVRIPCSDVLHIGDTLYVQGKQPTEGNDEWLVRFVTPRGIEGLRKQQQEHLRKLWIEEGLPGAVGLLHPLAGEFEFVLDHEAIRWGRSLKKGDKITLKTANPIEAVVKEIAPWREKTRLTLVADGFVQSDLSPGQRLKLHMPTPTDEIDASELPPDIDRPRTKEERVEWFLASTYCSCNVMGETCTGMFYTLASCNVHACGMPNHIRAKVAGLIDQGLADRQIWEELKKSQGPLMLKQHLLPK